MKTTYRKNNLGVIAAVIFATMAVLPAWANYVSTALSYGPVAYWQLNETAVSPPLYVITNSSPAGSALNGYGIDTNQVLTAAGDSGVPVISGQAGIVGKSALFSNPGDNLGQCYSKIDVPWNAANNPNPPFSIEFWVNPNSISGDTTGICPLSNFDPSFTPGSRAGWLFYLNSGGWQFRLGNRNGYAGVLLAPLSSVPAVNTWEHIVATWDGTTAKFYANGVFMSSTNALFANWVDNPQTCMRIGGTTLIGNGGLSGLVANSSNNGNRGWDGYVDEIAIYAKLLPTNTIYAHYKAASTNNAGYHAQILADGPTSYYELEEPQFSIPDPSTYPTLANSGTLGSAAAGTNEWGTLAGQPGPGYPGFGGANKAVYFDGENGYSQIADADGLHLETNEDGLIPITMAAWVKPTEQDFYRCIIEQGFDTGFAENFLRIFPGQGNGNGNFYEIGSCDGFTYYDDAISPIPPGDIGNWVFLAGTYDGSNWNLYRNGVLVASSPVSPTDIGAAQPMGPWTLGARQINGWIAAGGTWVGQNEGFSGTLYQPMIITNTLTAAQIYNLYTNADVPPVITVAPINPGTIYPATLFSGNVFQGETVSFSVFAEGNPTIGYLWTSNGISTGDTSTNYVITDIQAGSYTIAVVVTNGFGTNTPSVSFPVVQVAPLITAEPSSQAIFQGFPFNFAVTALGSPPFTYYWKLSNTVVQASAASNYTATAALASAGVYTVIVSNSTGTATSTPVSLLVYSTNSAYSSNVVASAPVAYWRLNETNGTAAYDSIGGNNGTYFSATLDVLPGFSFVDPDSAVAFAGVNSYAGNINGTNINFTGHTNFTLEAWVNAPSPQADQATIIAKGIGNNGTVETEQFALDVASDVYRFFITAPAHGGAVTVNEVDAGSGPNGTWQYVVAVYDDTGVLGSPNTMYIYVNGNLEATAAGIAGGLNATESPVSIGSKRTGNGPSYDGTFDGDISQVAVYSRPLGPAEIYSHYAAAFGNNQKPFISVQPESVTNYAGLDASITVGAAGTIPLTYQWYSNSVPVPNYDTNTLTYNNAPINPSPLGPLTYSDAGQYYVVVANTLGSVTSSVVTLTVLAPPSSPPVIPGLVLHLPFNGDLSDVTGRGNNGVGLFSYTNVGASIGGTVPATPYPNLAVAGSTNFYYVPDGVLGQGLHYSTLAITNGPGTTAGSYTSVGTNDYYVSLGVRPDLQFGAGDFTVSYWIRVPIGYGGGPAYGGGGDLPFFCDAVNSTFNSGFVFATSYGFGTASPGGNPLYYGSWAFSFLGTGPPAPSSAFGAYGDIGTINNGQWHSLVHVINHAANRVVTYVDGVEAHYNLQAGTSVDAEGDIDDGRVACIGQDPSGLYGETGEGDIEDLGVWNRALTALEADTIYISAVSNSFSFTAPVKMTISPTNGGQLAIYWPSEGVPGGTNFLQASTNVVGVFTNITGASSPYVFRPSPTKQLFFRVKQQ